MSKGEHLVERVEIFDRQTSRSYTAVVFYVGDRWTGYLTALPTLYCFRESREALLSNLSLRIEDAEEAERLRTIPVQTRPVQTKSVQIPKPVEIPTVEEAKPPERQCEMCGGAMGKRGHKYCSIECR